MGVGRGGEGGTGSRAPPLDFQTWYKYSDRDLKVLFFGLFCYFSFFSFRLFSVVPPPPPWKRLNSAIFGLFFLLPSLENFLPTPLHIDNKGSFQVKAVGVEDRWKNLCKRFHWSGNLL